MVDQKKFKSCVLAISCVVYLTAICLIERNPAYLNHWIHHKLRLPFRSDGTTISRAFNTDARKEILKMRKIGKMKKDDGNKYAKLLPEILINILMHLDLVDCIRAGRVCVSWRAAWAEMVARNLHPPSHHLPLLIFPRKNEIHTFFNLSDKNVYGLHLPQAYGASCLGSFDGWVILMDKMIGCFLLNVTSRDSIQLPRQIGFSNSARHRRYEEIFWEQCLLKDARAILSSDPTSGDCRVVIICSLNEKMALCRVGDPAWRILEGERGQYQFISSITFYSGRLIMLCRMINGLIKMYELDPSLKSPKWKMIQQLEIEYPHNVSEIYLVESCGELLMVLRSLYGFWHPTKLMMISFSILKMERFRWIKVESLGDQMLFLSYSNSKSVSAKALSGFKGNCIYFTDHILMRNNYSGMFDLEDGSILPFFIPFFSSIPTGICDPSHYKAIWVTPYPKK